MKQVTIAEAKTQRSDLADRAIAGEFIVIARHNKPLVKLVTVASTSVWRRKPGSAKGQVVMAPDFDAPLEVVSPRA